VEPVIEEKKRKKRKMDKREDLTGDERMAVEMYKAIKRNKTDLDDEETNSDNKEDEDGSEVEEKDDENDGENDDERVHHNDEVELDDPEEAERRGITYKIAKNKVRLQKKI